MLLLLDGAVQEVLTPDVDLWAALAAWVTGDNLNTSTLVHKKCARDFQQIELGIEAFWPTWRNLDVKNYVAQA